MLQTKQLLTVVAALSCAAGIGFVMQNSDTARAHYGDSKPETVRMDAQQITGASAGNAVLDVQEITLTSAEFEVEVTVPQTDTQVAALNTPPEQLVEPEAIQPTPDPACEITASARPAAAAMVSVTMQASCLPNERITIHHNGMLFTETTSETGTLDLKLPALTRESVFVFAFANGDGAVAQTTVEDIAQYDRAVLQWKGDVGFQIHAREYGADYGTKGHVWTEEPGDIASAVIGMGGVLTSHGDTSAADPLLAEVYTFPKSTNGQAGTVNLSVETEVTAANCGLEIEAQSLEVLPDGQIKTQNLILPVPDCEATGSFLVLNNLLQDLKVAGK